MTETPAPKTAEESQGDNLTPTDEPTRTDEPTTADTESNDKDEPGGWVYAQI